MKPTASLAGMVGLVVLLLPAPAPGQADTAAGPTPAPPSGQEATGSRSDWSRIVRLEPGREIFLIQRRTATRGRHLVRADELGLTVLDVSDPGISGGNREVLVRTASDHPDYFLRAQQKESFSLGVRNLRVTPEGVFEGDRKVVGLDQVVEHVAREDVVEISVLSKHVGRHVKRGVLIGAIVGAGLLGIACAAEGCGDEGIGLALFAAGGGGAYGALFGSIVGAIAPRSPEVIYRR